MNTDNSVMFYYFNAELIAFTCKFLENFSQFSNKPWCNVNFYLGKLFLMFINSKLSFCYLSVQYYL